MYSEILFDTPDIQVSEQRTPLHVNCKQWNPIVMQQANLKRMKFGLTHFFPRKPSSRSRFIRLCFGKPGFLPDSSMRRVLPQCKCCHSASQCKWTTSASPDQKLSWEYSLGAPDRADHSNTESEQYSEILSPQSQLLGNPGTLGQRKSKIF